MYKLVYFLLIVGGYLISNTNIIPNDWLFIFGFAVGSIAMGVPMLEHKKDNK